MKCLWSRPVRSGIVGLLICTSVLIWAGPAAAVRRGVSLGAPAVIGRINNEAFFKFDLPLDSLAAWDVDAEEALLVLEAAWPGKAKCVSILPIAASAPIPDGAWTAEGSLESFWERACPVTRSTPDGYYCVSIKSLVNDIHDGTCSAAAVIIGAPVGLGACGRFPPEVVEALDANSARWSARLDFFDATIVEEEQ